MLSGSLSEIRTIVFDLDDTLYDKCEWQLPAIERAASQGKMDGQRALSLAMQYLKERGCADAGLFNHVLLGLGQSDSALNIKAFIDRVKSHRVEPGSLAMFPGVREALVELRQYYKLGIVSVGCREMQYNKITGLGLTSLVDDVSIEEDKPDQRRVPALQRVLLNSINNFTARSGQVLYVADNPFKDFITARNLGMLTVRILSGEYSEIEYPSLDHAADYDLSSVARLPELMKLQPPARIRSVSADQDEPAPVMTEVVPKIERLRGHQHSISVGN